MSPQHFQYTPLEYRIAIADECGADNFRSVVTESNSNTDAAIYYRKHQLQKIATTFGIDPSHKSNKELRSEIRLQTNITPQIKTASTQQQPPAVTDGGNAFSPNDPNTENTDRFAIEELAIIAEILDVTPDTPYAEIELRRLAGSSIAGPYLAKLLEAAHVDLYLSANVGSTTAELGSRAYYPHRLEQVNEIPDKADAHPNCHQYIVDSAFKDSSYDNQDVLDTACRVNADYAILADEYQDMMGTVRAVIDGVELARKHEYNGNLIIPLQHPHDECYRHIRDRGISNTHTFAIGGLKNSPDTQKIQSVKSVRNEADTDLTIHGLGFGITEILAEEIRSDPKFLDSIDYSTPIQDSIGENTEGKERMCSVAATAGAKLIEDLRCVSPLVNTSKQNQRLSSF